VSPSSARSLFGHYPHPHPTHLLTHLGRHLRLTSYFSGSARIFPRVFYAPHQRRSFILITFSQKAKPMPPADFPPFCCLLCFQDIFCATRFALGHLSK